ncbi:MAG: MerR family transcriptional regulator [Erysipelotrichaceae bacterium]
MNPYTMIRDVSKQFDISTRTLRYYEEIGLLKSTRLDESAYRFYDQEALRRLDQIVILKKLRFSLRDIHRLLSVKETQVAIEVVSDHLKTLDDETQALVSLRNLVEHFLSELKRTGWTRTLEETQDGMRLESLRQPADPKETENRSPMAQLDEISKKTQKHGPVRIVKLPPMRMAAYRAPVGPAPEQEGWNQVNRLLLDPRLRAYPNLRIFGFNNPSGRDEHGYEFWVSVPEDVEIVRPFKEIRFNGGLYAAHVTALHSIFETWMYLVAEIKKHPVYRLDPSHIGQLDDIVHPHLEESIGEDILQADTSSEEDMDRQLDLFLPIMPR